MVVSGRRPSQGGVTHIPPSEYLAQFEIYGIYDPITRTEIQYLVNQMDQEYTAHENKRISDEMKKTSKRVH